MFPKIPLSENRLVAALVIGFFTFFILAALIDFEALSLLIQSGFRQSVRGFGLYWQWMMLVNFVVALIIGFTPQGGIRLGRVPEPTIGTMRWLAMIMCTLLVGGGFFWSAAEPLAHFLDRPPAFKNVPVGLASGIGPALGQSFLHWGFLAWSVLGTASTIVLMYAHHQGGLKLRPRALLYPLMGDRLENHWLGAVIDAVSVIAVAAATIGAVGFLVSQLGYSIEVLGGWPDHVTTRLSLLVLVVILYSVSAFTGVLKGIQLFSILNALGAVALIVVVLIWGPTDFIFTKLLMGFGSYLTYFTDMSLTHVDPEWNSWWTWYFWGWFIGFAPMMAVFIARISEGRSIRELILIVAIVAPLLTNFGFAVLGGAGLFYEVSSPETVSGPLLSGGPPAALMAVLSQLPGSSIILPAALVLTVLFVITTADSIAYTIAMVMTGHAHPAKAARGFWGLVMGLIAAVLLFCAEEAAGLGVLQSLFVVLAAPISLLIGITLIAAPIAVFKLNQYYKKRS